MSDDLQRFREAVREFVRKDLAPHQEQWRQLQRPDPDAWLAAGRNGILLPDVPAEYGGGEGTFAHRAVVVEELARAGVQFGAFIQGVVAHYILAYGNDAQKRRWLPRMACGDLVAAIAVTEPGAGSDVQGIQTTACRDGDHYVINGSKSFVTNGWHAGLVCLAARTDTAGAGLKSISLIMVETTGLPGFRVGKSLDKVGQQSQDTCELVWADSRVPAGNLLGPGEGQGFSQMMEQMDYERLAIAVTAIATAEQAVASTTCYVKKRMASGKPLMDFQNTRFKLAECATAARVGRAFLDDCIARRIDGQLDASTAAMAKLWTTDCECHVVDECLQLHGGYGYVADNPVARMWTDSRVHRIYAGTNEVLKELIAWSL